MGRRFALFVIPFDSDGAKNYYECGWHCRGSESENHITFGFSKAQIFTEGEPGHGTAAEWSQMIQEDFHPGSRIVVRYLDEKIVDFDEVRKYIDEFRKRGKRNGRKRNG